MVLPDLFSFFTIKYCLYFYLYKYSLWVLPDLFYFFTYLLNIVYILPIYKYSLCRVLPDLFSFFTIKYCLYFYLLNIVYIFTYISILYGCCRIYFTFLPIY